MATAVEINQVSKVVAILTMDNKAVGRALLHMRNMQTAEERKRGTTILKNRKGFMKEDAWLGCTLADWYAIHHTFTPEQITMARSIAIKYRFQLAQSNKWNQTRKRTKNSKLVKTNKKTGQLVAEKTVESTKPAFTIDNTAGEIIANTQKLTAESEK